MKNAKDWSLSVNPFQSRDQQDSAFDANNGEKPRIGRTKHKVFPPPTFVELFGQSSLSFVIMSLAHEVRLKRFSRPKGRLG
jgi:hypothetical protein